MCKRRRDGSTGKSPFGEEGIKTFHICQSIFCSVLLPQCIMQYSIPVNDLKSVNDWIGNNKVWKSVWKFQIVLPRSRWEELKARSWWQGEHNHHCDEGEDEGEGEGEAGGVWADKVSVAIFNKLYLVLPWYKCGSLWEKDILKSYFDQQMIEGCLS